MKIIMVIAQNTMVAKLSASKSELTGLQNQMTY